MKIVQIHEKGRQDGLAIYPFLDQHDDSNWLSDTHINVWNDANIAVPVLRLSDGYQWDADKIRQFIDALDVALDMIESRKEAIDNKEKQQ